MVFGRRDRGEQLRGGPGCIPTRIGPVAQSQRPERSQSRTAAGASVRPKCSALPRAPRAQPAAPRAPRLAQRGHHWLQTSPRPRSRPAPSPPGAGSTTDSAACPPVAGPSLVRTAAGWEPGQGAMRAGLGAPLAVSRPVRSGARLWAARPAPCPQPRDPWPALVGSREPGCLKGPGVGIGKPPHRAPLRPFHIHPWCQRI